MDIAVLGATGTIGRHLVTRLEAAGHSVRPLSRASGVDAFRGTGLEEALTGADVAVDALNIATIRGDRAVSYFTRTAQKVARAAERGGVRRVVCVSIAGAADPAVNRLMGYYRGKAAQERLYREARIPATIIHSTQWYELAGSILSQASLGPVAVLPTMRMAPVAAARVASFIEREIENDPLVTSGVPVERGDGDASGNDAATRTAAIRGPEELTSAELVRRILATRGSLAGRSPRLVTELPYLGRGLATGGLIPADAEVDDMTLEDWLRESDQPL
ncbi:SDR family oxidoreductase [Brachybacterium sp. GCM10030268]